MGEQAMSKVILIFCILLVRRLIDAQNSHVRLSINPAVDTSNEAIASVVKVWEAYLNSNPDSDYVNPYWLESEQRRFKPFDLVDHTWFSPSLYFFLRAWKP